MIKAVFNSKGLIYPSFALVEMAANLSVDAKKNTARETEKNTEHSQ